MRYIDGTRYMSAAEYAELKRISKGRVSQLKSKLPFERLEDLGVELINYDKLELELDERQLMELRYNSKSPVHQYTYRELGKFFSKLLGEMTRGTEDAIKTKERVEEERDIAKSDLFALTQKHEILQSDLQEAQKQIESLQGHLHQGRDQYKMLEQEHERVKEELTTWKTQYEALTSEKAQLLAKVLQLQDDRATTLVKLTQLETNTASHNDLREEFTALKELVTKLLKKKN